MKVWKRSFLFFLACFMVFAIFVSCDNNAEINIGDDDNISDNENIYGSDDYGVDNDGYKGNQKSGTPNIVFPFCRRSCPSDRCGAAIYTLYCQWNVPVIYQRTVYTEDEAVAECRLAQDPVWSDISDCVLNEMDMVVLASCLAQRGWPPEFPEIFDWHQWRVALPSGKSLPGKEKAIKAHALNFWATDIAYEGHSWGTWFSFFGALIDPSGPDFWLQTGFGWAEFIKGSGTSTVASGNNSYYSPQSLIFEVEGETLVITYPNYWDYYDYENELFFVPK